MPEGNINSEQPIEKTQKPSTTERVRRFIDNLSTRGQRWTPIVTFFGANGVIASQFQNPTHSLSEFALRGAVGMGIAFSAGRYMDHVEKSTDREFAERRARRVQRRALADDQSSDQNVELVTQIELAPVNKKSDDLHPKDE
jgi:hypothetical protein